MDRLFAIDRRATPWFGLIVVVPLALAAGGLTGGGTAPPSAPDEEVVWDGSIAGRQSATVRPQLLQARFSAQPRRPTAAQLRNSRAHMQRSQEAWAAREPQSPGAVTGPRPGTETSLRRPSAPGTLTIFRNTTLAPPGGYSSSINEPAVSQSGKFVWYTHNWYAARSIDGGQSWSYTDPYADFADFCCDQDTIYDPARDMHLWYRQGLVPVGGTQNVFKLGASLDGGATWCMYTVAPTNVDGTWTNRWWDYPRLHLQNNNLLITTNLFTTAGVFDRMVLLRYNLQTLRNCGAASATYWSVTTGWSWSGVEGSDTAFYMGDTYNAGAGTIRIYKNAQGASPLTYVDRTVAAWTFTNRNGNCPILGASDPCERADQTITGAWIRSVGGYREIGFFWNVKEGGGFTYPYIDSATFREAGLSLQGQPIMLFHPQHLPGHGGRARRRLQMGFRRPGTSMSPTPARRGPRGTCGATTAGSGPSALRAPPGLPPATPSNPASETLSPGS
ncbi:MAG TPA: hypothetical protein VGQ47_01270 [Candidatus Limnocylindrales bacterium]|nr:hypothetical protein [Candidatus Limnocylindrales bacterium]